MKEIISSVHLQRNILLMEKELLESVELRELVNILLEGRKCARRSMIGIVHFPNPRLSNSLEEILRNNLNNAMNSIPANRVNHIVNLLVGEFSDDHQVVEKEAEYLSNLTSDIPETNQLRIGFQGHWAVRMNENQRWSCMKWENMIA